MTRHIDNISPAGQERGKARALAVFKSSKKKWLSYKDVEHLAGLMVRGKPYKGCWGNCYVTGLVDDGILEKMRLGPKFVFRLIEPKSSNSKSSLGNKATVEQLSAVLGVPEGDVINMGLDILQDKIRASI